MYLSLAFIRFLESLPSALAVGLLLLPRLIGEDGARFKLTVAVLAVFRALIGFALLYLTIRQIFPADRALDFSAVSTFTVGTSVGRAWIATQLIAFVFAGLALARLTSASELLGRITLGVGVLLIATVSLTGHAIDDGLPAWTQISFLVHTMAGLTWVGGLLGLVWWMFTAHKKSPEVAGRLAERWSVIAKTAMVLVAVSGVAMAWENVGGFANMLATPYGRLLTLKLVFLCFALLAALMIVRHMRHTQPQPILDVGWIAKVGALESGFALALLAIAGYIAVITPASHETDLYWPLPFRLSYDATWGQKPATFTPIWWWAAGGVALTVAAVLIWFTPSLRPRRLIASPLVALTGLLAVAVSFSTEAYTDTYNDPTQDYTAESVTRGLGHFQANCTGCHGANGEGNGPMAKDLRNAKGVLVPPSDLTAPHVGTHTIGDIFHWLSFGGQSGVMPSFREQLDSDDRWDVINFLLMLSYANRSRFMNDQPMIQWLIAPDFALVDPEEKLTSLYRLRGAPTLVSFARCAAVQGAEATEIADSLTLAHDAATAAGAQHVTVYDEACPSTAKGREAVHAQAAEKAYSIINRYPNEVVSEEIKQAHFVIDRSGYVRARFKDFSADNGSKTKLASMVAEMTKEPFVVISLHSH